MSLRIAVRQFEPVLHAYQRESRTSAPVGLDAFGGDARGAQSACMYPR